MRKSRINRTRAVELINSTKGRFFTVTFVTPKGERTINCNCKKDSVSSLGYINVYSMKDKGYRNVNTRTIKQISFNNNIYKVF